MSKVDNHHIKTIQSLINSLLGPKALKVDGIIGKGTIAAYNSLDASQRNLIGKFGNIIGVNVDLVMKAPTTVKSKGFNRTHYEWVNVLAPKAVRFFDEKGLPGELVVYQATTESGWGRSGLATKSHNYSGLKLNSVKQFDKQLQAKGFPPLQGQVFRTREVIRGKSVYVDAVFAKFATFQHWAECHTLYLLEERYDDTGKLRFPGVTKATTVAEYGKIMEKGGYATDDVYVKRLRDMEHSFKIRKDPSVWV